MILINNNSEVETSSLVILSNVNLLDIFVFLYTLIYKFYLTVKVMVTKIYMNLK